MQFENSFSVSVPLDQAWAKLLDVPTVAPCVPGAELTEVVSQTEYKGMVTIKLGAVKMTYRGTVNLEEVDEQAHRILLRANGSEARGSGAASATVTSTLADNGSGGTTVNILSDIAVTGRVAQFGRNIMQDVAGKLIQEFAACLESGFEPVHQSPSASDQVGAEAAEPQPADGPAASTGRTESPPSAAAAEVKVLPIVVDVTRARLAKGLAKLAKVIDPTRSQETE